MSRREHIERCRCAHEGCAETTIYVHDSMREYRESSARHAKSPWKCIRHSRIEQVLSESEPVKTVTLTSMRRPGCGESLFWVGNGVTTGSGFVHGSGFMAYADDFPEGTRLEVTARVLPPVAAALRSRAATKGDGR